MVKRFFLKSGAEPIVIGCWPLLLLAMITFLISIFYHWVLVLCLFFALGLIVWCVVCGIIDNKYVIPSSGLRDRLVLKVKDGQLLEASNHFWIETGYEYYTIVLPDVTEGSFEVTAYLSFEKEGVSTEVSFPLVCYVKKDEDVFFERDPRKGFYPQEVYDFVIRGGQTNLRDMIKKFFKNVAGNDPAVKRAFEEYHANALELKPALAKALNQLSFSLPLSNIYDIKVTIRGVSISL